MKTFPILLAVFLVACGARSGLDVGSYEEGPITTEPEAPSCPAPSPLPPCAQCRYEACKEEVDNCNKTSSCLEIQMCVQENCYGVPLNVDGPESPLNECQQACAAPYENWEFGVFLKGPICAQWDKTGCDQSACSGKDDYEACKDSLGICATEEEIAQRCRLLWWVEREGPGGWGI